MLKIEIVKQGFLCFMKMLFTLIHAGECEPDCDAGADHHVLQHQRSLAQDQLHEDE